MVNGTNKAGQLVEISRANPNSDAGIIFSATGDLISDAQAMNYLGCTDSSEGRR
jgi:hypothetical protein